MGALEGDDGAACVLWADFLVGRAPEAALKLAHDSVSWRHASVRWDGSGWELQDLGSLNGTFVNDKRLDAGQRALLRVGDRIRFGDETSGFLVVDADPPEAAAVALDDGQRIALEGGILALPDSEQPEVTLHRSADGTWIAESLDRTWLPGRDEVITAAGRSFRFEPGGAVHATTGPRSKRMTPASIELELSVSLNEEQVDITVRHGAQAVSLRPRAHSYLLLTLARARLADQENAELGASSHGWIDQSRLLKMLATTPAQLALDIYRARRQLESAGVHDSAHVIERRPTSKELRIGVDKLTIRVV
jgi:hypothetical protein